MIIDGHSHACGRYLTAEGIESMLDKCGANKAVIVPGELNSKTEYSLPDLAKIFPKRNVVKVTNRLTKLVMKITRKVKEIPEGNEYVYNLQSHSNGRVIQFVWITTAIKNPSKYLNAKLADWNFQGVKLHQCWETFSIDSDFFKEVAIWTENHDLPLFIHLYSDNDVLKILDFKRNHPNLKLIIAHLFGLEIFIRKNFKDKNLFFDSSPLQLISGLRLNRAIDYVGASNVLFGTDTPYGGKNNLYKSIERINNLKISNEDKQLILGLNIKNLLKI